VANPISVQDTAVGRVRWALGHVLVAVGGTTVLMLLVGVGAGVTRAVDVGRFGVAGWIALAAFVLLGELGPLLGLDQWAMDLSPLAAVTTRRAGGRG